MNSETKKVLIPLAAVAAFVILVGTLSKSFRTGQNPILKLPNNSPKETVVDKDYLLIGKTRIYLDIADTQEERAQGLSGLTELNEDQGMLFVFEERAKRTFWMKGMLIPIDIVWISNGKVIEITENVPPPDPETPDFELPRYSSSQEVDYVLEVNAGFSERNGIEVGDKIIFMYYFLHPKYPDQNSLPDLFEQPTIQHVLNVRPFL